MDNVKTRKFMSVSVTVFFTWCSEKEVISFFPPMQHHLTVIIMQTDFVLSEEINESNLD